MVSQTITALSLHDALPISAGANTTIQCPATPSFTPPTASDTCGGATVNLVSDVTTPGTWDGTSTETQTRDTTDCSRHHSTKVSQTITVADTTPPTIGSAGALRRDLDRDADLGCDGLQRQPFDYGQPDHYRSFPTRRSSDLGGCQYDDSMSSHAELHAADGLGHLRRGHGEPSQRCDHPGDLGRDLDRNADP